MSEQMRNDFEASGAGGVWSYPVDWDDPSVAEARQIWQAATLVERERCALVCEARQKATGYQLGPNTDCADAIRKGGAA